MYRASDAIVVGVEDTPAGRDVVRAAAVRALRERAVLHLVAAYDRTDTAAHRAGRTVCPADVEHLLSPYGDAEALLADAADAVADLDVLVRTHVRPTSLRAAVREVSRAVAPAPGPVFERREVAVDGRTLSYRVAGSGPPVVLVHGLFSCGASWTAVAEQLRGRFTVIAPDLPGHGDSSRPRGGDYSLDAHTVALRDLLDRLGLTRVTLVGHSMGGGVAMNFAGEFPGRVERLVLVSSGGLGRDVAGPLRLAATPGAGAVVAVLASRPVCGGLRLLAGLLPRVRSQALVGAADVLAGLRTRTTRRAALATLRAVVGPGGQRGICALHRMLELREVPTLVVWGSRDRVLPVTHGIAAHQAHRASEMLVLDGTGHHPQVSRAPIVADAIARFAAVREAATRPAGLPEPACVAVGT